MLTVFIVSLIAAAIVALLIFIWTDVENCIRRSMERPDREG